MLEGIGQVGRSGWARRQSSDEDLVRQGPVGVVPLHAAPRPAVSAVRRAGPGHLSPHRKLTRGLTRPSVEPSKTLIPTEDT